MEPIFRRQHTPQIAVFTANIIAIQYLLPGFNNDSNTREVIRNIFRITSSAQRNETRNRDS